MAIVVTQEMLTEALAAYHHLMVGAAVAEFRDQNRERLFYAKADSTKLWTYITWLQSQLDPAFLKSQGPMTVWM